MVLPVIILTFNKKNNEQSSYIVTIIVRRITDDYIDILNKKINSKVTKITSEVIYLLASLELLQTF